MPLSVPQNFYKETVATAWATGGGNFYVSTKPTVSVGYLVLSPENSSLREIVKFTAVGTDGGGDYVTVSSSDRGLGGTTEQAHAAGEAVYMNITAQHIEQIKQAIEEINASGALNASTTTKGVTRLSYNPNESLGNPTVTIADPAVVTLAGHGLTENDEVQFTTDGALPTGITSGGTYYVVATGLTTDTFQFSATFGGSAVATTGSQSGTHTLTRTTPEALSHNDPRIPNDDTTAALAGGGDFSTPSTSNKFTTEEFVRVNVAGFGNGSDGDLTIDSGDTVTLTEDKEYENLTVNGTLVTDGYMIKVRNTISGSGTIRHSAPTNGANATAGAAGSNYQGGGGGGGGASGGMVVIFAANWEGTFTIESIGGSGGNGYPGSNAGSASTAGTGAAQRGAGRFKGLAGAAGGTTIYGSSRAGQGGGSAAAVSPTLSVSGKNGGAGGTADGTSGGSGGAGGAATAPVVTPQTYKFLTSGLWSIDASGTLQLVSNTPSAGGGGSGSQAASNQDAGGGGGGGGGNGGNAFVVYKNKTWTGTATLTGGAAGASGGGGVGNSWGPGSAGAAGDAGSLIEVPFDQII